MQIKTDVLTGPALDWVVASISLPGLIAGANNPVDRPHTYTFRPSICWQDGGPIIEREKISVRPWNTWDAPSAFAAVDFEHHAWANPTSFYLAGATPLIAAMRCYVASKLGNEVDIPDGLGAA